jgi:hypothetical protein
MMSTKRLRGGSPPSGWGGDEELAGGVEGVGVPSGVEHALAEDQVDVAVPADAEAGHLEE